MVFLKAPLLVLYSVLRCFCLFVKMMMKNYEDARPHEIAQVATTDSTNGSAKTISAIR